MFGFDVGGRVAFNAERFEQRLFGPEETHREKDQLAGIPRNITEK